MDKIIGRTMKAARERAGLSQGSVFLAGVRAGYVLDRATLSRFENEKGGVSIQKIGEYVDAYAIALGVPPADLLHEAVSAWGEEQAKARLAEARLAASDASRPLPARSAGAGSRRATREPKSASTSPRTR